MYSIGDLKNQDKGERREAESKRRTMFIAKYQLQISLIGEEEILKK
jgi:hypothetical protein